MNSLKNNLKGWLTTPITQNSPKNLYKIFRDYFKQKEAIDSLNIKSTQSQSTHPKITSLSGSGTISSYPINNKITAVSGSYNTNIQSIGITGSGTSYSGFFMTGTVVSSFYIQIYKLINDKYIEIKDIDEIEINEDYYISDIFSFNSQYIKFYVADMDIFKKDCCEIEVFMSPKDDRRIIKFSYKDKIFTMNH